jgi:hypothetical protein
VKGTELNDAKERVKKREKNEGFIYPPVEELDWYSKIYDIINHVTVKLKPNQTRSNLKQNMASVGSVTRQIAALEISAKQNKKNSTRPLQKTVSQTSVSKLLTKFAPPHPFPPTNKPTVKPPSQKAPVPARTPSPPKTTPNGDLDIGKYDGGFEIENEKRGEAVEGEAAQELALDSSVSMSVFFYYFYLVLLTLSQNSPHPRVASDRL